MFIKAWIFHWHCFVYYLKFYGTLKLKQFLPFCFFLVIFGLEKNVECYQCLGFSIFIKLLFLFSFSSAHFSLTNQFVAGGTERVHEKRRFLYSCSLSVLSLLYLFILTWPKITWRPPVPQPHYVIISNFWCSSVCPFFFSVFSSALHVNFFGFLFKYLFLVIMFAHICDFPVFLWLFPLFVFCVDFYLFILWFLSLIYDIKFTHIWEFLISSATFSVMCFLPCLSFFPLHGMVRCNSSSLVFLLPHETSQRPTFPHSCLAHPPATSFL